MFEGEQRNTAHHGKRMGMLALVRLCECLLTSCVCLIEIAKIGQ